MIILEGHQKKHPGSKELIDSLRHKEIDDIVYSNASDIDTVAKVLSIDPHYLSIQVRLLIPFYSEEIVLNKSKDHNIDLIRDILVKLRSSLASFEDHYKYYTDRNGILTLSDDFKITDNGNSMHIKNLTTTYAVRFGLVNPEIGLDIQDNLHYIHRSRADTKFHFGLYLREYNYPLCYCSFSICDRKYQAKALSNALNEKVNCNEIYVLTRSFGFSPLPHNMMSKLFDRSVKYIRKHHRNDSNYPKYIITALNPFLGFNGGIFLGSSFIVFATSPMSYLYNVQGLYNNRRTVEGEIIKQSLDTPPIVWLARPLTTKARKSLEKIGNYYVISEREYDQG